MEAGLGASVFTNHAQADKPTSPKGDNERPKVLRKGSGIHRLAWGPDSKTLAAVAVTYEEVETINGDGQKVKAHVENSAVRLWDTVKGEVRVAVEEKHRRFALAFSRTARPSAWV